MKLGFQKFRGISWLTDQLLTPEEGPCSVGFCGFLRVSYSDGVTDLKVSWSPHPYCYVMLCCRLYITHKIRSNAVSNNVAVSTAISSCTTIITLYTLIPLPATSCNRCLFCKPTVKCDKRSVRFLQISEVIQSLRFVTSSLQFVIKYKFCHNPFYVCFAVLGGESFVLILVKWFGGHLRFSER